MEVAMVTIELMRAISAAFNSRDVEKLPYIQSIKWR
jgi:hypothetical protein